MMRTEKDRWVYHSLLWKKKDTVETLERNRKSLLHSWDPAFKRKTV